MRIKSLRLNSVTGVLIALVLANGDAKAATEVNTCGQVFAGSGFLAADLDCTGFPTDAVIIDGGSLDLRGFTLTGGAQNGVGCARRCKVFSDPPGGRIVNSSLWGVAIGGVPSGPFSTRVRDVELDGNGGAVDAYRATIIDTVVTNDSNPFANTISADRIKLLRSNVTNTQDGIVAGVVGGTIRVIDSILTACGTTEDCINAVDTVTVRNSTVNGAGDAGIVGTRVSVIDSEVSGNAGSGIDFFGGPERLRVIRSQIINNGGRGISGESAGHVVIKDSDVSGNALEGIFELDVISIEGSTITNNGRSGVSTGNTAMFSLCDVQITDSTLSGNGTDLAVCGVSETCADVATCGQAPDLGGTTTCETSYDTDSGFPGTSWGVCSLD